MIYTDIMLVVDPSTSNSLYSDIYADLEAFNEEIQVTTPAELVEYLSNPYNSYPNLLLFGAVGVEELGNLVRQIPSKLLSNLEEEYCIVLGIELRGFGNLLLFDPRVPYHIQGSLVSILEEIENIGTWDTIKRYLGPYMLNEDNIDKIYGLYSIFASSSGEVLSCGTSDSILVSKSANPPSWISSPQISREYVGVSSSVKKSLLLIC